LFLTKNKINCLPENLVKLKSLSQLHLANNNIHNLEIGFLPNLQLLDLSNNYIKNICQIGLLTNLETLEISNNEIEKIPKELEYLINLQKLNLSNNLIKNIDIEIKSLINLNHFDVSSNLITELTVDHFIN